MANTVQVTFGANIQPLVDGVESAKTAIQSFIGAFAVDRISNFVDQYAKLGDQIESQAKQFGASTTEVQQLTYSAKMAGDENGNLASVFGRLEGTLQQAQNPTSRQAQALTALGLSAKSLIGLPLPEQLGKIADAFAKYGDGTNKSAIAQTLFRNSSGELIGMLDQGSAGLAKMRQQAIDTGAVMSGQTVAALGSVDRTTIGLKATLSTLSGSLVALASNGLISLETELTASAGDMVKLVESGYLGSYALRELQGIAEQLVAQLGRLAVAWTDAFTGQWGAKFTSDMAKANAIAAATDKKLADDLAAIEAKAAAAYQTLVKVHTAGNDKPQPPPLPVNNRDEASATIENINAMVAAQDSYYSQQVEHINSLAKTFQISEAQKTAMLIAAVNSREAMQTNEIEMGLQLQGLTQAQYAKFQDELTKYQQKAAGDRQKDNDQALQDYQKQWTSALTTIESAFNSQLRGLLAGTETWNQAFKKMAGDMVIKFIETCETILVRWIALEAAKTAATITGNATRSASDAGAGTTSALGDLANIAKSIFGFAGETAAGVSANVAPVAGPAAPAIGAAAGASVEATAMGYLGSFDVGSWQLPSTGLAMVHRNEMIVPDRGGYADSVRAALSGGGHGASRGGGGLTRSDLRGLLADHRDQMGAMMSTHRALMGSVQDQIRTLNRKLGAR